MKIVTEYKRVPVGDCDYCFSEGCPQCHQEVLHRAVIYLEQHEVGYQEGAFIIGFRTLETHQLVEELGDTGVEIIQSLCQVAPQAKSQMLSRKGL